MSKILTLRPGDRGFRLTDGVMLAPRAYFEISDECPASIRLSIERAVGNGYLRAVASVYEHEQVFNVLKDTHEIN